MQTEASVSNSGDPLSGLSGPLLFPRTIRASPSVTVPSELKDLESIHNFIRSLDVLRSPEKLMNEAKRIVDGGAEVLESDFAGFTKNVSITKAFAAKGEDKPQDRRPGLGVGHRKRSFSLKPRFSQPSANLDPNFDIDQLEDPDEFWNVYERNENAKKEIQKQLGGNIDNINHYKPSNIERVRRPSILGKTYKYKHHVSSTPAKIDDIWMSSQETASLDMTSALKDLSQEKVLHPDPDPNPGTDLEESDAASNMKTVAGANNILEELLSRNMEDLEGPGALNLLQERLNIMPLDTENLCMTKFPDVGSISILTASKSRKKLCKSSVDIDSVMKTLSWKRRTEQDPEGSPINSVSLPTPLRSPLECLSLMKKKLQPLPMIDPFSPLDVDLASQPNQHKDKIIGEVNACLEMKMSSELESRVEICNSEPPGSDIRGHELKRKADSLILKSADESSSIHRATSTSRLNTSPAYLKDKILERFDTPKNVDMPSELESHVEVGNTEPAVSNMNVQEIMRDADDLPDQFVDENVSIRRDADIQPIEESDNNIEKPMDVNNAYEANPPVSEVEVRFDASSRQQIDPEQPLEVPTAKPQREKRVTGEKRIKKAHPLRKSLAEAGTTFENGVRRSKRIRSRPLEFWKGERFIFGRVGNSVNLIGVKCFSTGEGSTEKLKVKPYISLETTENKKILEFAALH